MNADRFLNRYEEVTYGRLLTVCEPRGAHVFAKVRLADILPIAGSGISSDDFGFALKAHADFLVTNRDYKVEFCVEFDGPSHQSPEQIRRDLKKNRLFDRFDQPLLRINSRYLDSKYRGLDLLTYFIEVWFLEQAFYDAQENGHVPFDEPFDPAMVVSARNSQGHAWPYWLSLGHQVAIQRYYESGRILDPATSHWVGQDGEGTYRCLAWLCINESSVVFVKTGMCKQRFPAVVESELLRMLAVHDLRADLDLILGGRKECSTMQALECELERFQQHLQWCGSSHCGNGPKNLRITFAQSQDPQK